MENGIFLVETLRILVEMRYFYNLILYATNINVIPTTCVCSSQGKQLSLQYRNGGKLRGVN